MRYVAKLALMDNENKYLLLRINNHPLLADDPDLPGGTLDEGERPIDTMVREVYEETSIHIDPADASLVYAGTDYSKHGTHYSLYSLHMQNRPKVTLSWEHSSYEWLSRADFLQKAAIARDTYMQMVCDQFKHRLHMGE